MHGLPVSPHKEVRQIARYAERNNFTFIDLDASGHWVWSAPDGSEWKHASTPSKSWGWTQARRQEIDAICGRKRGKRDSKKVREKAARERERIARNTDEYRTLVNLAGKARADELIRAHAARIVDQRRNELISLNHLMTSTPARGGQRPRF